MNGSSSGSISLSGDRGTQQQQQPTQQPQPLHHHQGQHRPSNSSSSSSNSVNINHSHSAEASVTSKENEEAIGMDEHEHENENENDEQRQQHQQQQTEQTPRRAPQEHAAALEQEATAAAATAELAATTARAASGMRNNTISRPIQQQQEQQDGDEAESSHTDDENDDENDHPEEEKQPMQQQQQQQHEPAQQQHHVLQQQRRERYQQRQRQRQHPPALGNPNNIHYRQCPVCGRFPYRCPDMLFPLALPEGGGGGADPDDFVGEGGAFEAGIYEFLYRLNPTAFEEERGGGEFGYNDHGEFGYYPHHPTPSSRTAGGCPPMPLSLRLNTETAQRCMERCERHVQRLQVELARAGLLHSENQSYICGDNLRSARMIAPFDYDEIKIGPMLGTGGFSTVYEISSFLPKTTTTINTAATASNDTTTAVATQAAAAATTAPPPLNTFQIAARDFLTKHAQRQVDDVTDISVFIGGGGGGGASSALHVDAKKKRRSTISTIASAKDRDVSSSKRLSGCVANSVPTTARYAIKHLRRGLLKDPDRFERAAIDLALEAQLLVAMDHENIMSLRGWARSGPKSYVNGQGKNTDYFLILDKLPETLDDVIYKWRKQLKKYKTKLSRPWIFDKAKFVTKLDTLLLHRLHAAQDVAAALEYMHDRRIINRDVKSANIGFDVRGDLKLFDFGLSRLLPSDRPPDAPEGYVMSRVGTKYYMAPEIKDKCPYNLSADVYSFGVVLWEILACATPREVLHRLQNKRQPESSSQRQYQRKLRGGGGGNDLLEAMACADNAGTVALQQRHRDGRCKLPICTCWPDEIQAMVKEALSNDPTKRPSMADLRFRLEEEAEKLGSDRRFDVAHRRSTFRIDLTNHIDNTETGNGEESINNNDNDNDDNHDLVPAAIVLSNSMESRSSHDSSFQQLAVRV